MFGNYNISQIVEGHVNELLNKQQELSTYRLNICERCPLYTNGPLGPICDSKKCIDPNSNLSTIRFQNPTAICGCGCRLKAKTTLENAHCVLSKW